ncbi:hypothetical protein CpipJ_CPIJ007386 [Culex quinquefasciatus]|uniref:Uncharacterized protein n=1 Tax=Culex quinquefasciatus TaxID=7176 RepID=B0WJF0_CULQU|nr:hypothetical protein CpipJ_CPIJ007386 [Culex quinquefasciatus]|eukprot:XP_001848834.1 hypothetical protein CpipJ_CPIJ007386 [Culex quinquefasciatus]
MDLTGTQWTPTSSQSVIRLCSSATSGTDYNTGKIAVHGDFCSVRVNSIRAPRKITDEQRLSCTYFGPNADDYRDEQLMMIEVRDFPAEPLIFYDRRSNQSRSCRRRRRLQTGEALFSSVAHAICFYIIIMKTFIRDRPILVGDDRDLRLSCAKFAVICSIINRS